jgi:hypothetical protein
MKNKVVLNTITCDRIARPFFSRILPVLLVTEEKTNNVTAGGFFSVGFHAFLKVLVQSFFLIIFL